MPVKGQTNEIDSLPISEIEIIDENSFPSNKEEQYFKNGGSWYFSYSKPLPLPIEIKKYKSDFFDLKKIHHFRHYNDDSLNLTPYQDSITLVENESKRQFVASKIGGIYRNHILKYEKKGDVEAIVYYRSSYEQNGFFEPGIWIGYSDDGGRKWSYYYTGIVQMKPIYVKWYSDRPLIKSKRRLEIEGALFYQKKYSSSPDVSFDKFELLEDGICICFDLDKLKQDKDSDGLTDIVERKFYLNPQSPDTDNDGIMDNVDLNPRYSSQKSSFKTWIYEALLDDRMIKDVNGDYVISEKKSLRSDTTFVDVPTYLIITDDSEINSIQPQKCRFIFVNKQEFRSLTNNYEIDLPKLYVSPLFEVDNSPDTYRISIDSWNGGYTYIVKKDGAQWRVFIISMSVS